MRKRYTALLLAMLAVLGVAVQATASDDDGPRPSEGVAQVSTIEQRAAQALSVLRAPRGAGDALPAGLARRMGADAPFGTNPELSRLAIGNATHSVFVIPARDHVCVSLTIGEGANLSCPSTDDVAAGEASGATIGLADGIAVYGLVPDGVTSVSIQADASTPIQVEVTNNAYYTVVPKGTPLRHLRYVGPSGPVEFRIYDPDAAFGD